MLDNATIDKDFPQGLHTPSPTFSVSHAEIDVKTQRKVMLDFPEKIVEFPPFWGKEDAKNVFFHFLRIFRKNLVKIFFLN